MKDVFSLDGKRLEAIHTVIDNSQIDERHSVFPVEYIIGPRPLAFVDLRIIDDGMDGLEPFAVQRKHVFHVVFHDFTSQEVRRYRGGSPANRPLQQWGRRVRDGIVIPA